MVKAGNRGETAEPPLTAQCSPIKGATAPQGQSSVSVEMKLKHLESAVQCVEPFREPNIALEQYATSPHLAARMIFTAHGLGDIEGKRVCDLGCGCAMLSICAELMGSASTTGVDVDAGALEIAAQNCERVGVDVEFMLHDVPSLRFRDERCTPFDTALMNPPFGTRTHGIDMAFVQAGLRLAGRSVYSLHQSSTREHILKKAKQWGVKATVIAEMHFDLPATYKFHKEKSKDIAVDMIHFLKPDASLRLPLALPPAGACAQAPKPPPAAAAADGAAVATETLEQLGALQLGSAASGGEGGEVLYDCENDCGFFGGFSAVEQHEQSCTHVTPAGD